jgi:hypothetical protein
MARSPWYRALTGCLQTIPGDEENILVQSGNAEVGELRPQPFLELARALTADQRVGLAVLAIADIAVWPEVDLLVAERVATALLALAPLPIGVIASASDAAEAVALHIIPALRTEAELEATWEALRVLVHSVLRRHPFPVHATEQWLRRVVPMAVRLSSESATKLTVDALRCSIGVPAPWIFRASRYDAIEGSTVGVIAPPHASLKQVARFAPYRVDDRKLLVSVEALIPLDTYRLAFLFQSLYLEDATRDAELGGYDEAICLDAASGIEITLSAL